MQDANTWIGNGPFPGTVDAALEVRSLTWRCNIAIHPYRKNEIAFRTWGSIRVPIPVPHAAEGGWDVLLGACKNLIDPHTPPVLRDGVWHPGEHGPRRVQCSTCCACGAYEG